MGLAGKPDDAESFETLKGEGVELYVARDVWERYVEESGRLCVLLPGHGMAWFRFEYRDEESTL